MQTSRSYHCFVEPTFRKPGLRPNNAEMSPAAFAGLVAAWSAAQIGMLVIAIVLRAVG